MDNLNVHGSIFKLRSYTLQIFAIFNVKILKDNLEKYIREIRHNINLLEKKNRKTF